MDIKITCPECGGAMKHIGVGTQRAEEELHALFMPDASFHVGLTPVAGDGLGPYGAEDVTLALRPHAGVDSLRSPDLADPRGRHP